MSACPDCTKAQAERWHGGYRMGCAGCAARAVARSTAMRTAMLTKAQGDIDALKAQMAQAMPQAHQDEARKAVLWWWRADRLTGDARARFVAEQANEQRFTT